VKGPTASKQGRWEVDELEDVLPALVARARANTAIDGRTRA
jgi:hypothetical protein